MVAGSRLLNNHEVVNSVVLAKGLKWGLSLSSRDLS